MIRIAIATVCVAICGNAVAQPLTKATPEIGQTSYGRVTTVSRSADRVTFTLSPAVQVKGCEQLTFYTDAKGPSQNLPTLRVERASAGASNVSVTYLREPTGCLAYVVNIASE